MSEFKRVHAAARAGDQQAIDRWYRDYGPALKLVAKRQLRELHLQRVLEPDDILDSVFGILCLDPSRLDDMDPWQVYAYFEQLVNYKAITAHRRRTAQKRGNGTKATAIDLNSVPSRSPDVSDELALHEDIHLTYATLSSVERKICMHRADKNSWQEIGELLEMSAAAARKQYERVVRRVRRESQAE
ncbi:MAG: ECF-type sigma factor [Planctomycetota bacterium]|nr:ECF-type sigma factor [Planctomycetota bacterium]